MRVGFGWFEPQLEHHGSGECTESAATTPDSMTALPLMYLLRASFFTALSWLPLAAQQSPFARLPADATTVMYLGDVAVVVNQIVDAPEMQKLMKALDPTMREMVGMPLEAKRIKAQIRMFRELIPKQVAFACPAGTVDTLLLSQQASLLSVMLKQAVHHGMADYEAEVRAGLAKMFQAMGTMDAVCVLTMSSERAAESAQDKLVEVLSRYLATATEPVRDGDATSMIVAPFLHLAPAILELWVKHKIEAPKVLADGFAVRVFHEGAELVVAVGKPTAGPLEPGVLGDLWDPERPPLILSQMTPRVSGDAIRLRQLAARSNIQWLLADAKMIEAVSYPHAYALHVGEDICLQSEHKLSIPKRHWMEQTAALQRVAPPSCGATLLPWNLPGSMSVGIALWDAFGAKGAGIKNRLPKLWQHLNEQSDFILAPCGMVLVTSNEGVALVVLGGSEYSSMTGYFMLDMLRQDLGLKDLPADVRDLGLAQETYVVDLAKLAPALGIDTELGKDADLHFFGDGQYLVVSTSVSLSKQVVENLAKPASPDTATLKVRIDGDTLRSCVVQMLAAAQSVRPGVSPVLDAVQALLVRVESLEATGTAVGGAQRECWSLKLR